MADTKRATLTDWVLIAISPALIMLMVGSLTFFFVEVLYAGKYVERLLYTLFFFVFAIVLVARLSIEEGYKTASIYGLVLAVVTFLALLKFGVPDDDSGPALAPLYNLLLMAAIWWASHKLTWDCTHLSDDRKTSGRGMLAAAGLGGFTTPPVRNAASERADQKQGDDEDDEQIPAKYRDDPDAGPFERWKRYRARRRLKPHTPGVWILYFSLAAFPIFGLGQSLIPPTDDARRRATFIQMALYLFGGLGLLVTTSLLGLRKYLRERIANVPASMTYGWLGFGAGIIVLFLLVGAILPRPHSETPLVKLSSGKGEERGASKNAVVKGDGAGGKGEGRGGQKQEADPNATNEVKGKKQPGAKNDPNADGKNPQKGDEQAKGKNNNDRAQNDQEPNDRRDDRAEQDRNDQDPQNRNGQQRENQRKQQDDRREAGKDPQQQKNNPPKQGEPKQGEPKQGEPKQTPDEAEETQQNREQKLQQATSAIGKFLQFVMWWTIVSIVVVGCLVFLLLYMSNFVSWAERLLNWLLSLFGRRPVRRSGSKRVADVDVEAPPEPKASLRDYPNPFDTGDVKRMSMLELLDYTFAAFEGWANDHDLSREPAETPTEFAARIGEVVEGLDEPAHRLATLYLRGLYSNQDLPAAESIQTVKQFWIELEVAEAPVAVSR